MADELAEPPVAPPVPSPQRRRLLKDAWRKVRVPIARSQFFKSALARTVAAGLRGIHWSNRIVPGSSNFEAKVAGIEPVIVALWHGQHLLSPCFYPRDRPLVALFSR